ncbi:chromate resistance protein ChrB domain-containing protein [Rhodanobacter sp. 115]|uniref:chromate resistance protein ChrB domain-containing protein n=1 Tax=Rhodanobacter sp. FW021-MT20 TaxID=1162282 RepID=UPI000260DF2A|nr:chromate resistance protein ChrB domain-containing protein [Rhodanobacter sp. 115]EIL96213.1 hypothetical protein UU5_07778 [Rhodanobacter sp. 115]
MQWITREHPKIDRIACPWLVTRFIDPSPEFLYVPADEVLAVAQPSGATPFDAPGVELGHHSELCGFDAFLAKYALTQAAQHTMARIVCTADCGRPEDAPEAARLLAISRGLSLNCSNDHFMLGPGMVLHDALDAWCDGHAFAPHLPR